MASDFRPSISIKEAIDHIDHQDYLLPAIQRKFVWSASQIETLFDSIMRGYPINSFMFWHITDKNIKRDFKFYKFLSKYREFFNVNNPSIDTAGFSDFDAIIDGQQRLTSLYIGIKGTYAYKIPRKWWIDNEDSLPTRRLYLDLSRNNDSEREELSLSYNFKFLTDAEYNELSKNEDSYWFLVRDILSLESISDLLNYQRDYQLKNDQSETLALLWQRIHSDKRINYYQEEKQDIDSVLDIFIRTNSGGVPLSFSNLLMSITIANWKTEDGTDARESLATLVKDIFSIGKPGFIISEDFILKTCLVLHRENIKFNVKNFNAEAVQEFSINWARIRKSIVNAFTLLETWGFNNDSLRAKYAIIPIIYFIYIHNLEDRILKKTEFIEEKGQMRKWLCIALLKGVFGGQPDNILTKIRKELNNTGSPEFPLDRIIESFRGSDRNFTLDDDFIEGILKTQKDHALCYPILALIYSHMNFENDRYHKDHLHPASTFSKKKLIAYFGTEESIPSEYYLKPEYWNGIVNLQLLNAGLNESKNDEDLESWLSKDKVNKETQLIPDNISYSFKDFVAFYDSRKELLAERLRKMTSGGRDPQSDPDNKQQEQET